MDDWDPGILFNGICFPIIFLRIGRKMIIKIDICVRLGK